MVHFYGDFATVYFFDAPCSVNNSGCCLVRSVFLYTSKLLIFCYFVLVKDYFDCR